MKTLTKLQKRRNAEKLREHQFLEEEKYKLDFIRDCGHVMQSLTVYLVRNQGLSEAEIDEIREVMTYLSRGEIDEDKKP
jgi:hypothetical protein